MLTRDAAENPNRMAKFLGFLYFDTNIISETSFPTERDAGDARHWAVVSNYLKRYLDGVKIVNSDEDFNKFIREEGFKVIDPEKISIEDLKKDFAKKWQR